MFQHLFITVCLFLLICTGSASQQAAVPDSMTIWLDIADEAATNGRWTEANSAYLAAQKYAAERDDKYVLCRIQTGFAKIAANSNNNDELKRAITLAETYCTACNDSLHLARIYLFKGILYYNEKQFDVSAGSFKTASDILLALRDTVRYAAALVKVGNVLEGQEKYAEANVYYQKYYDFAQTRPHESIKRDANIYLAGNYLNLNKPEKALPYVTEVKRIAEKLGSKFEYSVALQYEADAFYQLGQFQKAYDHLKIYANYYRDTLINAEKVEQMEALRAKYETEQKETQIALQAAQLTSQNRTLWGGGAVLAVALIAGFFLFSLTRQLRKRNTEKEFLIKEIHHRVKNNLQVLSSLLHLQSRRITDETALDAVREGQNRVDAMGLIHQKLYMGDNLAGVEMREYLRELGDTLIDSFGKEASINIEYQLSAMHLDVDSAIPLGLIINELLTNSLKYAYPEPGRGTITLALWQEGPKALCLRVSDNGGGVYNTSAAQTGTSFGTNLVQMLSKKLKGKPEITTGENGYSTFIRFEEVKFA